MSRAGKSRQHERISQRAGFAVSYGAAGHQLMDPEVNAVYTYNEAGRIRTASVGGVLKSTRYYNGMGQRAIKDSTPYDNRVYRALYGEDGKLLSESVLQGGTLLHYREYVWLEDRPVAQLTNVKSGSSWTSSVIDYLHTNQLERPLFMTDSAGTEVYRWQPVDAFGTGTHNTDVDGNGQHRDLRLGFPGQIYDAEVDSWYNYYRDYNGRWGRYLQSDPIGLEGGINTYAYAFNNPLRFTDPKGLMCQGTDCPDPPFDPSPDGPRPSPTPQPPKPSHGPPDAPRYDICRDLPPPLPIACEYCVDYACTYAPAYCCDIDFKGCVKGQTDNPQVIAECNARLAACMARGGR